MNFSAVTIFLARVVEAECEDGACMQGPVSKNARFPGQAATILTSGYVLIVHVLVKIGRKHTLRCDFSEKKIDNLKPRLACS